MITDKDREDLIEDIRAYNDGWMLEEGKDRDRLIEFENVIRAESADQARKEAADRAVDFLKKEWYWFNADACYANELRTAILGDTAPVSTDSEKLAIAVKALKNIIDGNDLACERGESMASWMDSDFRRQAKDALKEIQG